MPNSNLQKVRLDKFVQGGQALGLLESGKKIFVWGGLPTELVEVRVTRNKSSYSEGIVENIIEPSTERIEPLEPASYLSTSPWQIMDYSYETQVKKQLVIDASEQHSVALPEFEVANEVDESSSYSYRNKMEYSFYGDEKGVHLALFKRGTHYKSIVKGSKLADPAIDKSAQKILELLKDKNVRAGDLKSLIIRTSNNGDNVGCLFVKTEEFLDVDVPSIFTGFSVYYSNPKSPASVPTKLLQKSGKNSLSESINGNLIHFGSLGFFQVNIPVFEQTIQRISKYVGTQQIIDMYGGVGTITTALGSKNATIIESDSANIEYAQMNTKDLRAQVINESGEKALEYITKDKILVVDPPRAGLHQKVVDTINEVRPKSLVYLSCNPVTMMRDLSLIENYTIVDFTVYNFFPRTPHIECLAVLKLK